jgi:molecular chaperone HtpG
MQEQGTISVHTENIFPIIKKFLYSDQDIFLRELVANAVDATQKLIKLSRLGEYNGEVGDTRIRVSVDKEAKTITVSDRGLGMTGEEVKKYINQIAFSGATEFVEKFKDADSKNIIGKFGLGFYSAFMVADTVEIISKSYKDAPAAHWTCTGTTDFTLQEADKEQRGTDIVLHVNEDGEEYLEEYRIRQILEKHCRFLPVEIVFGTKNVEVPLEEGEVVETKEGEEAKTTKTVEQERVINTTDPLWTKSPSDLTDEDYLKFYKELYPMSEEPLFWIHLNVDYPFELTGVLYFPKVNPNSLHLHKDKIQLYSRQVFITDEVKDIVPEFLTLLHGVIDSPDIPLNVSRSYLQSDSNVKKISSYISKKVAEKLDELFKEKRESFEEKWDSLGVFVKYGVISDTKFAEKAKSFVLLQNTDKKHFTLEEYAEKVKVAQTDKNEQQVWLYTNDPAKQSLYIDAANKRGYDVLVMDGVLDNHFIGALEQQQEKTTLKRVDADSAAKLVEKEEQAETVLTEEQTKKLEALYKEQLGQPGLTVTVEAGSTDDLPATLTVSEFMRRMKEMSEMQGMGMNLGALPDQRNLVLNGNHPLVSRILDENDNEKQKQLVHHTYHLALLAQGMLSGKELSGFIRNSVELV